MTDNYSIYEQYIPDIAAYGRRAESLLYTDTARCIQALSEMAGRAVSDMAGAAELFGDAKPGFKAAYRALESEGMIPVPVCDIINSLRITDMPAVSYDEALMRLRLAFKLAGWMCALYFGAEISAAFAVPEECDEYVVPETLSEFSPAVTADSGRAQACAGQIKLQDSEYKYLYGSAVTLELEMTDVINAAFVFNGGKIIRSLTVRNESGNTLNGCVLRLSGFGDLFDESNITIDGIADGEEYFVSDIALKINYNVMSSVTERISGNVTATLSCGEKMLARSDAPLTLLAYDEWQGSGYRPEMLCAFSQPNHPAVTSLVKRASELLGQWTGDPSLDAYQTKDKNRVLNTAAAVYSAIREQRIAYAVHPASFETAGQRVRLCDSVIGMKTGNCLDLTLLYTACIEACGLNPVMLMCSEHIFAGVWLDEQTFSDPVINDYSVAAKRISDGVDEIAVIECTAAVDGKNIAFDEARSIAAKKLTGGEVEYIIDVKRTRNSGVRPLPSRTMTENGYVTEEYNPVSISADADKPENLYASSGNKAEKDEVSTRLQTWERKLLDLGLRNALINMRITRETLPLLCPDIDELENILSDGGEFSIEIKPAEWTGEQTFEGITDVKECSEVLKGEFKSKRIRSGCTESELKDVLKELYRSAKTSIEENGANSLYLALGALRWYETEKSTKPRYAPLVLIPVEIVRKSMGMGYRIKMRDEEAQMNVTLIEKLKQDFGIEPKGLDPLPSDEHGADVRAVFTEMRRCILAHSKWDVLECAAVGIFSFSQFVMWNDIKSRSDDLARNKVVRSLMDGKLCWDAEDMEIDGRVSEDGVFMPMAADASQLYAIRACGEGKSFVLHGPPGTGKSQTITSMIANALAQGKSVLFVAEKMAALEVVQKRLKKIGIAPFCMELHSNKSRKKDVLEQLRTASEVARGEDTSDYIAKANAMQILREELNSYADALHRRQECGLTLYGLIDGYEKYRYYPDITLPSDEELSGLDRDMLDRQSVCVERLAAAANAVRHPRGNPLYPIGISQYSQKLKNGFEQMITDYLEALCRLEAVDEEFSAATGASVIKDISECSVREKCASGLVKAADLPQEWLNADDFDKLADAVTEAKNAADEEYSARAALEKRWKSEFLVLDADELKKEIDEANGKWALAKNIAVSKIMKRVSPLCKTALDKDDIEAEADALKDYQIKRAGFEKLVSALDSFSSSFVGNEKTRSEIPEKLELVKECREAVKNAGVGISAASRDKKDFFSAAAHDYAEFVRTDSAFTEALGIREDTPGDIPSRMNALRAALAHSDELREWCAWNAAAEEAVSCRAGFAVNAFYEGLAADDAYGAYYKALCRGLIDRTVDSEVSLSGFSGAVFNEKIEQLKRMEEKLTEASKAEIYYRLASRVPDLSKEAAQSSELGILQRAIRSGGRGMSIRKLFGLIPNLLPKLCPCMLMSPISAAQYLDPSRAPFDIVIFDEASQLPTCKAVGALARGENAVIVGDPKQMPPTSFFKSSNIDEDDLEHEDLESILDDCLALNMPSTHLLWHYRSQHESLIAFSNARFYENRLYTFPSVDSGRTMVSAVYVEGVFERGGKRQNRQEAEAVVAELKRRAHDEKLRKFSVGVVTFNINQQNLIDDLLYEASRDDAVLDEWAYNSEEPVFIKNLENVQGDERDVILFSVGYGPDERGRVIMNFGPLNRDGGWRRLNVAISRSRIEMIVYSTLKPEDIDLNRSASEGVASFKAFLEYAFSGRLNSSVAAGRKLASRLEGTAVTICDMLEMKGWKCRRFVGHSEYKIDIGVVDPENEERFILGIQLDGETYRDSQTTRDRESAQLGVLTGLGWNILRVWTMDWWDNSRRELTRILAKLEELTAPEPEENAEKYKSGGAGESTETAAASVKESTAEVNSVQTQKPDGIKSSVSGGAEFSAESTDGKYLNGMYQESVPAAADFAISECEYTPAVLQETVLSPSDFILPQYEAGIRERVKYVMLCEAPISEGLMTKRILLSCRIAKTSDRLASYMDLIYRDMKLYKTVQNGTRIYWGDVKPEDYSLVRRHGAVCRRDPEDIPLTEIENAMLLVLHEQISLSRDDLLRQGAKKLGFTRCTEKVISAMSAACDELESSGKTARTPNGNITGK